MRKLFFCAMCALALVACKKGIDVPQGEIVYSITGDYSDVTSTSANLSGYSYIDRLSQIAERGVWVSENPEMPENSRNWYYGPGDSDREEYTVLAYSLRPSTTYYYKSYVRYRRAFGNEQYHCGEVKSFTTLPGV